MTVKERKIWIARRVRINNALLVKYGKVTPTNQKFFNSDFRFLENLWKEDATRYEVAITAYELTSS